jgi:hypothetical protein
MSAASHIVDSNFSIRCRPDYILEITVESGLYGKAEVEKIVKTIHQLAKGQEYLILVLAHKNARITLSAVKFLSSSEALKYALAKAYVIQSRHQRVMANLFSTFLRPLESIRFFKTKNEAEVWLTSLISPGNEI